MGSGYQIGEEIIKIRGKILKNFFIYFIPKIDERDGNLIYIAEPFLKKEIPQQVIIVMPFEFSIILEDDSEEEKFEPSRVVKLTFWDLLETFDPLTFAINFIIYHQKELDEIGKQLEGYKNQFWGASEDHILDEIFISRQIYHWLEQKLENAEDPKLIQECIKFHKRNGIVEIDENDDIQKPFFERAVLLRRKQICDRERIQSSISKVTDQIEKEAYLKAKQLWENLKEDGRILYYPPGEMPII